jgi:hypothetical protein
MAGEVLPFFWPMRNFIHHNPLHGLEHLPFEQAVAEASHLFHARGYLPRVDYQQLMQRGSIQPEVIDELVAEFVTRWLARARRRRRPRTGGPAATLPGGDDDHEPARDPVMTCRARKRCWPA